METYALAQGIDVRIAGGRRLQDQLNRYLGAHAETQPQARPGAWSVRNVPVRQGERDPAAPYDSFGEACWISPAEDGGLRLGHPPGPDQVWRLDQRAVEVLGGTGVINYGAVQSVYAAIRTIGLIEAARSGWLAVLHAAAVWTPTGAILLCGPKGAGKTTLCLALMVQGAAYMASDRTIAWQTDEGTRVCGWMGSFRASPGAFNLALPPHQAAAAADYISRRRAKAAYWFARKFRFPPHDLIRLCAWPAQLSAAPRLLVALDPGAAGSGDPVELSRDEVEEAWCGYLTPGGVPAPLAPSRPRAVGAPPGLDGIRLRGWAAPQEMASRILQRAGDQGSAARWA